MAGAGLRAARGDGVSEAFDLARRASYGFFFRENLRFSDTDMVGHINNVAFAALLESGRTMFTHRADYPALPEGVQMVMARVEIDYRLELHWPGQVDVGTRPLSVGRSSYRLGQGIFRGEDCVTLGRTVLVLIDRATRRPVPIPDAQRDWIAREITSPPVPAILFP